MRSIFFTLLVILILPLLGLAQLNTDSLLTVLDSKVGPREKAVAAIALGTSYLGKDLSQVKKYAQLAMDSKFENDSIRTEANDLMAKYYFFTSNLDSANYFFNEAKDLAVETSNEKKQASLGLSLGSVLIRQSKFDDAIETLIKSTDFFESIQDEGNAAKGLINISTAHAQLKNYTKAIEYGQKAYDMFDKNGMSQFTLLAMTNIATNYLAVEDTDKAISNFLQAEKIALDLNNQRSLAIIYNNLGDLYLSTGIEEYDKAKSYIEKSINAKMQLGLLKGIENNYHNLGYIYHQQGNPRRAIGLYNQALETSDLANKVTIYKKLKDSYQALGQPSRALEYADLSISLKDSVDQVTNTAAFAEISTKYETAKKENEILQLESKNTKLEVSKNRNRSLFIGAGSLLIGLGLISFLYFKNQKRKQLIARQNHELEQKRLIEEMQRQELASIDRIIQGQDEERNRISADLHDSLGSKMATLKLFVDELDEQGSGSAKGLEQVREIADIAYQEVRNMSHQLNSGVLVKKGLIPAIRSMADLIAHAKNIQINVIDLDSPSRLGNIKEIQIFRIIQELLTNIVKHAEASEATIQIAGHEDMVSITVEDNGKGFSNKDPGLGLANIANRVSELSGNHEVDSVPGEGTSVIINVPI